MRTSLAALASLSMFAVLTAPVLGPLAPPAAATPSIGHIQTFSDGTTGGWTSNDLPTNPGTGGLDGAGDGFLDIALTSPFRLGARSTDAAYTGDWIGANVNRIKVWLNELDQANDLEIHLCIGNSGNFWESNVGFAPPTNTWAQFTFDLTDSTQFTHIINFSGGFAAALQSADNILLRHDKPPFAQTPKTIAGEFGVDNVELTNTLVDVQPLPVAGLHPVELAPPFPNPSRGAIACAFDVFDAAPVRVTVSDARGRLLHAESLAGATPGRRTWMWNGLDDHGRTAPSGVYRVRVTGQAGGMSRPFVLLR